MNKVQVGLMVPLAVMTLLGGIKGSEVLSNTVSNIESNTGSYTQNQIGMAPSVKVDMSQALKEETLVPIRTFTKQTMAQFISEKEKENKASKNIIYSPVSLYMALGMAEEGAVGNTKKELNTLLASKDNKLGEKVKNLYESIYRKDDRLTVLPANSVWLNKNLPVEKTYLDALSKQYYADAFKVNLGSNEAKAQMADWVNAHTNNFLKATDKEKVSNQKEENAAGGAMVLYNTLYFNGKWQDDFDKANTKKDDFTLSTGKKVKCDFMNQRKEICQVLRTKTCDITRLAFKGGSQMTFILPKDGVRVETLMQQTDFPSLVLNYDQQDLKDYNVNFKVPKFDFNADTNLTKLLHEMGLKDSFSPTKADFSAIAKLQDGRLYIDQVIQKARIAVDEEGCEAAAHTEISFKATCCAPDLTLPELDFNLDKPFGFVVSYRDVPLFVGIVNEPQLSK